MYLSWVKNKSSVLIGVIFLVYTLITFGIYLSRTLEGDVNNHILAGDMWGTPTQLLEKGIKPLYHGAGVTGWDGQFYYYISNDLFALKDTSSHIDAPAYRYQRVGLSLYAGVVAAALGKDWVSPTLFITSYFFLALVATILGGKLLQNRGVNPYWILLWSLSPGTQITIFNALPDAAADSFLIIALYLVTTGWLRFSCLPFVFAALSREVYVIFPIAIWAGYMFFKFSGPNVAKKYQIYNIFICRYNWLLTAPFVFLLWQIYLTFHFGNTPSSQMAGILGLPYAAWFDYFISGINGHHKLVGKGFSSYAEGVSLFLFLCVDVLAFLTAALSLGKFFKSNDAVMTGLAVATLALALLYACFGPTVMMHYTGYAKAMQVLILMILLTGVGLTQHSVVLQKISYAVMLVTVVLISYYNLRTRIFQQGNNFDSYTKMSQVKRDYEIQCLDKYRVAMRVTELQILGNGPLDRLFLEDQRMLLAVELTNLGEKSLVSTRNSGSVHVSSQWLDTSGQVVMDGERSALLEPLEPGQKATISVITKIPRTTRNLTLQISPVQEGCAWFYRENLSLAGGKLVVNQ